MKKILILIASLSFLAQARMYFDLPGCYEIRGIYMGYENGYVKLKVFPESRSEFNLLISSDKDPNIVKTLKIKAQIQVTKPGFLETLRGVRGNHFEALNINSDIFQNWHLSGKDSCEAL